MRTGLGWRNDGGLSLGGGGLLRSRLRDHDGLDGVLVLERLRVCRIAENRCDHSGGTLPTTEILTLAQFTVFLQTRQ